MAEKYSIESIRGMSDKELREERSLWLLMSSVWEHLAQPLPEVIMDCLKNDHTLTAKTRTAELLKYRRGIRAAGKLLNMINEELTRRGLS